MSNFEKVKSELAYDNILDIVASIARNEEYFNNLSIVLEIEEESVEVVSVDRFMSIVKNFHFDKDYVARLQSPATYNDLCMSFIKDFDSWKVSNNDNFIKIYNALISEFNPLENYDRYEDTTLSYSGSETDLLTRYGTETDTLTKSGSETNTLTRSGSETNTLTRSGSEKHDISKGGGSDTHTHSVSPENNDTYYGSEKNTDTIASRSDSDNLTYTNRQDTNVDTFNNRQDTNVDTFNNRQDTNVKSFSNRTDETEHEYHDRQNTTISHIHGNIGTVTATQMISEVVSLYGTNVWEKLVNDFLNAHCVYLPKC